jgi:hypothetical protein
MSKYFFDGLKEVTAVNDAVHLEFHRLEAVRREQSRGLQPITEFILTLPVEGSMQALGVLESVSTQFAARGLIGPAGSPEGGIPHHQNLSSRRIFRHRTHGTKTHSGRAFRGSG